MPRRYTPSRGDVVWLTFHPQAGHEQAGRLETRNTPLEGLNTRLNPTRLLAANRVAEARGLGAIR